MDDLYTQSLSHSFPQMALDTPPDQITNICRVPNFRKTCANAEFRSRYLRKHFPRLFPRNIIPQCWAEWDGEAGSLLPFFKIALVANTYPAELEEVLDKLTEIEDSIGVTGESISDGSIQALSSYRTDRITNVGEPFSISGGDSPRELELTLESGQHAFIEGDTVQRFVCGLFMQEVETLVNRKSWLQTIVKWISRQLSR